MDLAMQFRYSYMAMSAENTRPYPAELIDTPDGPYIVGTGAPLLFFTSAYYDDPAIVSTQLGKMERKPWPKSLLDLPHPFNHVDVISNAKKAAIFFVEEFHIHNVRHVRPPTSLCDLFQGFDAVGLYMYGVEFCYPVMYYIGQFAQEYQWKMIQMIDSCTKNLVEKKKKYLIQLPRAENSTVERILHRVNYKITEQMNKIEEKFFWERIFHYRKMIFDEEKINPLKRHLDPSFSNIWPCSNDNQTRSTKYEPEARRDLKQNQTMNESDSSLDLITNPMCRLGLENPSTKKFTYGTSFVKSHKFKNYSRIRNRKEKVPIITEAKEPLVSSKCSRIPRPKISTPFSSERILSSTASTRNNLKSTCIPYVRSSDLISGNSKIPRLLCLKSQASISGSATPRKQPVKVIELHDRTKIITQATVQLKNLRKRKLSAQSQNSSPLKPDKLKKTQYFVKRGRGYPKGG
ncbi:unnamed protein product [Blumeria hordei]|uniref:Uncharacterized protein n=1 Tax=Blumeria hordei TaxID=2867405 RepID=A0A383US37_BLUHO|nr:unnamed protein product [Blumeria hordei]